ncbi:1-(5-phosphoribosyl)-5-[(5-phosphoribosylamino)methylideneamino]imidazole-4-carboxamide isomerase [Candidatus Margulisiibacteriota bacterium]
MFDIIPAIDLMDGCCVRLKQGKFEAKTIYSNDPIATAQKWVEQGAKWLHIVDLDGARTGTPKNLPIVKRITAEIKVRIQLGGGIRNFEQIEDVLNSGIDRVILGTSAVYNPNMLEEICKKYGKKIIVSIDAKDNKVASKGWKEVSTKDIITFAKEAVGLGIKRFVYTDISKDGMMAGPNFEGIKSFAAAVNAGVIASGGVSTKDDIDKLRNLKIVEGCIVGKAIYTGAIKLSEVL